MSEDIELQDLSDDHQQGQENNYANLPSSTPSRKKGQCSSSIVRYRCAVVFLGVLCALLAIIIRVMCLKTTSEANQIHTKQNNQLQLLQKTCKNFTEVTCYDNNTELQTDCSILSREKSQAETNYNILSTEKSKLEIRYNNLVSEKSILQDQYNSLNRETSQLRDRYGSLNRDKSQLQERCDAITAEKDTMWRRYCSIRHEIAQYSVDVTLDRDTAYNYLNLSTDGKQVKYCDTSQNRPNNPKRFDRYPIVLGKQGFSSGRFYYEVQVSGKTGWSLGVARASIDRKGATRLSRTNGYWTIRLRDSQYKASAFTLSLNEKPERVGVFVDYGAGLVSFYDADRWSLIYSYKRVSFGKKIYPYFSSNNSKGKNSAPLVITPVSCA